MFKDSRTKRVFIITIVMIMALSTVALAAGNIYTKQLAATYGRIKIKVDGNDITQRIEQEYGAPAFTADDRSYVPVRALAEITGMKVNWDASTHTAELVDTKAKEYKESLQKKDGDILKLNDEVNKLNAEIKKLKEGVVDKGDLAALQTKLNKDFKEISGVSFSTKLKESKDKITVSIEIDTKNTSERNAWRKMKASEKQEIIKDIVSEVSKDFSKFKVSGTLYDNYQKKTLYSFSLNTSGKVSISNNDYDDYRDDRYSDILYDAEDNLKYYFGRIAYVNSVSLKEKNNGDIYGTIDIDEDRYTLTDREIEIAFSDAEADLVRKYGSGTYLDVELYLNGRLHGAYYNGRFN